MKSSSASAEAGAPIPRALWWALALAGVALAEAGTFHWMVRHRWFHADGLYEHAPLLVLFGLWVLRREWIGMAALERHGSAWGLPLLAAGALLHLFAVFLYRDSLSGFALLPLLAGLLLVAEGPARTRRLLPVLCLIVFLVPLPDQLLKQVTFPLKMASTSAGYGLSRLFLQDLVARNGTELVFAGQAAPLVVGDACSGMRSALAMLTLGYCLAFFFGPRGLRRPLLLAAALPVAFAGNALRIGALALAAAWRGVEFASGPAHTWLGYAVYLVALVLLLALDWSVRAWSRRGRQAP